MTTFKALGINQSLLSAIDNLGYESPSPVQQQSIPLLLEGHNLLAQAQTGTGKTGAFALPILNQINIKNRKPQALILTPTRELAIQVAESLQSYAKYISDFHVLPIYGGQSFHPQLKALARGVHVIVGTPGRVMDHLRRGKMDLSGIKTVVLDEADEMLNMGFIDDVEWIFEQISTKHQTALFSATMPKSILNIADKYIPNSKRVKIQSRTETVTTIEQCYTMVTKQHKLEALTRFLEVETFDAIIIFTRTKHGSSELAEKLAARGYSAAAINGDLAQELREKVINRLKQKNLDIVVATEVAARGLDVDRISLVINYDIPQDPETYIHRIGRTGRAGRQGKALLFVEPREKRMLSIIERLTKQQIKQVSPPTINELSIKRTEKLTDSILKTIAEKNLDHYRELVENIAHKHETSITDIAAALASLSKHATPIDEKSHDPLKTMIKEKAKQQHVEQTRKMFDNQNMIRCRIGVGRAHGLQASDVVGLIANKSGVTRKAVGKIQIQQDHSLVDISDKHLKRIIQATKSVKLKKQLFGITPLAEKVKSKKEDRKKS